AGASPASVLGGAARYRPRDPRHAEPRGAPVPGDRLHPRYRAGRGPQAARPRPDPAARAAGRRRSDGLSMMDDTDAPEANGTEPLVAEVAAEFMGRVRRGERPEVEDYARRHPQVAMILRHVLPALQVIGSSASGRGAEAEIEPEGPLGDYRIVRELGR